MGAALPPQASVPTGLPDESFAAGAGAGVALGLLERAPDAALGVDTDGHVRLANPGAAALLGYAQAELRGMGVEELVPRALDGGADLYAHRSDGAEVPVEISLMPVPTADGELTVCLLRDDTERRHVEAELRASRQRLAEAEQLARLGSWEWDIPANRVEWSDQLFRIYGLEPGSIVPTYERFLGYVHPDDRADVDARNHKAFADHEPFEDVKRVVRADGTEILMRTQGEVVCDTDGNPIRMIGVCEDVTAEEQADRARSMLASIVRSSGDAIYAVDKHARIVSWNPAAERLYGYTENDAIGHSTAQLIPAGLGEHDRLALERVLSGEGVLRFETQRLHRDGELVEVALTISPIVDADAAITGASVIARDISERRRLEHQLRHLADHDGLTGLINRRRFEEKLAEDVADSVRYGVGGSVLAIDLDGLKEVNDNHGHAAGDAVLCTIARCLRGRLRDTDIVARLGGDEFAVILAHTTHHDARRVADELLDAIRECPVAVGTRVLHTTASIGGVTFGTDSTDGEEVLAVADQAMYAAKELGRNCVVVDVLGTKRTPQRGRGQQLRDALENDDLELYLQPIMDLHSGEIARYEALVRMLSPEGLVPPSAFISVAERLGMIYALDVRVLQKSISLLAEHPDLVLEVNVSGRSVGDPALLGVIAGELRERDVDPARLVLEITETAAIANMDDARRFADALGKLGCSFALDDFGAGFGSFYYLKHLPADILKIDGDFIAEPRSEVDELVTQAIVRIAQQLGKRTVAEFVGDARTVDVLRGWGVDFAQGFHIGRPFAAGELTGC